MSEIIKKIIAAQLGVDAGALTPELDLEDDLGADSLDAVEMIVAFEEETGISIPDDDVAALRTVGDLLEYAEALEA